VPTHYYSFTVVQKSERPKVWSRLDRWENEVAPGSRYISHLANLHACLLLEYRLETRNLKTEALTENPTREVSV
jgi:hypothetical protein